MGVYKPGGLRVLSKWQKRNKWHHLGVSAARVSVTRPGVFPGSAPVPHLQSPGCRCPRPAIVRSRSAFQCHKQSRPEQGPRLTRRGGGGFQPLPSSRGTADKRCGNEDRISVATDTPFRNLTMVTNYGKNVRDRESEGLWKRSPFRSLKPPASPC